MNLSKIHIKAGRIIKVAIRAKDIFITVIRPKSLSITNFEVIRTLNPPTVVSPDASVVYVNLKVPQKIVEKSPRGK
jgi:ABC-type molybdate transport system ATPase subunit